MSLATDFNSGKSYKDISAGGSSPYETVTCVITKAQIVKGQSLDHPLVQAIDKDTDLLELTIDIEGTGTTLKEYQVMSKNQETGKYISYARPRSDDGQYPASLCYDVLHAAKELDPDQEQLKVDGFSKEKFEGLKFSMRAKFLTDFVILETDRQKMKDEEYRASQGIEEMEAEDDAEDLGF